MYIGKTQLIHSILLKKLQAIMDLNLPSDPVQRRNLFIGPPGVAKTTVAKQLGLHAAGNKLNLDFRMGTEMNVEIIRDWVRHAPYRGLTVRLIDEIETTPPAAVTELRGYLDDLPRTVLFLATSNKAVKDLAEPLQTRFKVWQFDPVQTSAIAEYLVARFPMLNPARLHDIATKAAGNVRAALTDADSELDVYQFRQAA